MNVIIRIINRIRFKKHIRYDESSNVIDGMIKAKRLYKELSRKAHPDCNPERIQMAESLMRQIIANKHNYAALQSLEQEVNERLNK